LSKTRNSVTNSSINEHLLLALLDNPRRAEVREPARPTWDDLRKSLTIKDTPQVAGTDEVDTQPTLGFQHQRAIMHVQSTGNGKKEVTPMCWWRFWRERFARCLPSCTSKA
jgi:hypothetical protein